MHLRFITLQEWLYSPRSKRGVMRQCYYTLRHSHPGVKKRPYKRKLGYTDNTTAAGHQLTLEELTQKKQELKEIVKYNQIRLLTKF